MKLAVVGTGYVGLTAGICFAESGNDVICVDVDREKVAMLNDCRMPIYEPGLNEMLTANVRASRLAFTCDLESTIQESPIIFVAVGTPPIENGQPDTTALESVIGTIVRTMPDERIIVIKSTVPIGMTVRLIRELKKIAEKPFDIVSNPEFLKEGCAVDDFLRPDRVIIGTTNPRTVPVLQELYAPFVRNNKPIIVMDPTSAEMTKYAANAMLSTKISFINEIACLCDLLGGDINDVRRGICSDRRIGGDFLYPGIGFGGSCFPKDIQALIHIAETVGYPASLLKAVMNVNDTQKQTLQRKIRAHYGESLSGMKFAVWGLSFKPRTDDIRESPALVLVNDLLAAGAEVAVHDPQAMDNAKKVLGTRVNYCQHMYDALEQADGLCLATEWNQYRTPNFQRIVSAMRQPVVFDGRNIYEPHRMTQLGIAYYGIGRATNGTTDARD